MKKAICILLFLDFAGHAASIRVDQQGNGDYRTVPEALAVAQDGDSILVAPGEYAVDVPLRFFGRKITLKSESGPQLTTLKSLGGCVIIFDNGETMESVVDGFTVTGAELPEFESGPDGLVYGGAIVFSGNCSPKLVNCHLAGNVLLNGSGAAIYCAWFASPRIENCTITENAAGEGGGIFCGSQSHPLIDRCTIAGNTAVHGGGIALREAGASIRSSIIWANPGGSIYADRAEAPVSFSCVEGPNLPGEGNINASPQFCGWGDRTEVYVDGSAPQVGDGSQANPWKHLSAAFAYSFALSEGSPCLAAGEGGQRMGANWGTCALPGLPQRTIRLSPGNYSVRNTPLSFGVTVAGSGQTVTILEGTVRGLRSGAEIRDVLVTGGKMGGVHVTGAESPSIRRCTIERNSGGGGIVATGAGRPLLEYCAIVNNVGGSFAGAVTSLSGSEITIRNCTIAFNTAFYEGAAVAAVDSKVIMLNSIVWQNIGQSVLFRDGGVADVRFSCIENGEAWPGPGNIKSDPLFCRTQLASDVYVDAAASGPGTGTEPDPFRDLATPFQLSIGLSATSPCVGSGENGADMGSSVERCGDPTMTQSVVHVAPGTYPISVLQFPRQISLVGSGQDRTTIEGTLIGIGTGCLLADVTITKGSLGAVIVSGQSPSIRRCTMKDNSSEDGAGGVHCVEGASVVIEDCRIIGNNGDKGGAIGCQRNSSASISRCTIADNQSWWGGGLHFSEGSSGAMTACEVRGNSSKTYGGGLYVGKTSEAIITETSFSGNSAEYAGGAAYINRSTARFASCRFERNSAENAELLSEGRGGAIGCVNTAHVELDTCVITQNSGNSGGGVSSERGAVVTLRGSELSANAATVLAGGGACFLGSMALVEGCTVRSNWSKDLGGGVWCRGGILTLTSSTIVGNKTLTAGGAVHIESLASGEFSDCSLLGNAAPHGAGISLADASPTITNCVVAGNWSRDSCSAIYCQTLTPGAAGSSPIIMNSTIASNASPGLCCDGGSTPLLVNCIMWDSGNPWSCPEARIEFSLLDEDPLFITPGEFNYSREEIKLVGGLPAVMPSIIVRDPDLRLSAFSPGIDAGTAGGAPDHDIAGNRRPCGLAVDMGAYELCEPAAQAFVRGDVNQDGRIDIADAIYVLGYLFGGGEVPSCADAADANDDEAIQIADSIMILGFLFAKDEPLAPPNSCGPDPTGGGLGCDATICEKH